MTFPTIAATANVKAILHFPFGYHPRLGDQADCKAWGIALIWIVWDGGGLYHYRKACSTVL